LLSMPIAVTQIKLIRREGRILYSLE
jgi:hypothetical protein